jgi:hypothetical protein
LEIKSNIEQGELPEDFPQDFPIYKNAILRNNWATRSDNSLGISLVYVSPDKPEEIYISIFRELMDFGYNPQIVNDKNDTYTLSVGKDNLNGFIGIARDNDDTIISITVGIRN